MGPFIEAGPVALLMCSLFPMVSRVVNSQKHNEKNTGKELQRHMKVGGSRVIMICHLSWIYDRCRARCIQSLKVEW